MRFEPFLLFRGSCIRDISKLSYIYTKSKKEDMMNKPVQLQWQVQIFKIICPLLPEDLDSVSYRPVPRPSASNEYSMPPLRPALGHPRAFSTQP